jgi:hypothetical protein
MKPFGNMDKTLKAKTNTPIPRPIGKMEKIVEGLETLTKCGSNIKNPT